ncbi:hypothetical protein ACOMHN_002925 [Nucella lapillus]
MTSRSKTELQEEASRARSLPPPNRRPNRRPPTSKGLTSRERNTSAADLARDRASGKVRGVGAGGVDGFVGGEGGGGVLIMIMLFRILWLDCRLSLPDSTVE